jgi:ADP-ribose pyrophosphatase
MNTHSITRSRRSLHKGRVLDIGIEEVELPNGNVATLDVLLHPGAALVVPWDGERAAMIRQHRHCAGGSLWEFPAGTLSSADEMPVQCAHRELREEAGLIATQMQWLGFIFTAPGFTDEKIHLFLATSLGSADVERDEDEIITEVRWFTPAELNTLLMAGEWHDAKSLCAWLHVSTRALGGQQ